MALLLYKSNEMFSSTELIRKSKTIFNKILENEIEKAIILRDGKPCFMLMDFQKYEQIMSEYEQLKEEKTKNSTPKHTKQKKEIEKTDIKQELKKDDISITVSTHTNTPIIEDKEIETVETPPVEPAVSSNVSQDELSEEEEISNALKSIESMNFDENMKKMAQDKIRAKILQARKEREELLKKEQSIQEKEELKEELIIQSHIQEENKKKAEELKEFWD